MRVAQVYSHSNGKEYLCQNKPHLWCEIMESIQDADASICKTKISSERNKTGSFLLSPKDLNEELEKSFGERGWNEHKFGYYTTDCPDVLNETLSLPAEEQKALITAAGKTPIYSYNQTDFLKHKVAVEVQFGKYAFVGYDILFKHMPFYLNGMIDVAVEILPTKAMQAEMSSGPAYYEGELRNLITLGRGSVCVPLVLIGIEP